MEISAVYWEIDVSGVGLTEKQYEYYEQTPSVDNRGLRMLKVWENREQIV